MKDIQGAQTDMAAMNGKTVLQVIPTLEIGEDERTVIAFDHGGAVETIACPPDVKPHKATGLRVPLRDVGALADAIDEIITMAAAKRRHMGEMGRARILEHFSKEQMISKTISIYERVLGL